MRRVYRQGIDAALANDFAMSDASLAGIRARTLIVQGDRDYYFPLEVALDLYRKIPKAQLWVIPNATHSSVFPWKGRAAEGLRTYVAAGRRK